MLELFAEWITQNLFQLAPQTHLADAANFFIADTIKIFLLMAVIIFVVSVIRTYLPPTKVKKILSSNNEYAANFLASLIGIATPFCTCSAIPLFLGFIEAGVPLGVTFSFLVASPMINEVALAMLWGMFGIKIALLYVVSGLVIANLSGIIIGKMNVESLLEESVLKNGGRLGQLRSITWKERLIYAKNYTRSILKKVWPYVVLGIGLGAWIHGYVPIGWLAQYAASDKWYAVPLAVLIGIPLYSNAAGIIPIIGALTEKGVSLGTSLAFMMAVTGLSFPEFLILKKVMKVKLIIIFAAVVGTGIVITGYLFNAIL
ncbi:permease [bacterium]|nr:MAG: permease [bacterium]